MNNCDKYFSIKNINTESMPEDYSLIKGSITMNNAINPETRRSFLDYIMKICANVGFKRETFHKAAFFFDKYLNKVSIDSKDKLQLISLSCINLAAKLEEIDNLPITRYLHFYYYTNNEKFCNLKDYYYYKDKDVLQKLSWKLNSVTIFNQLHYVLRMWENNPIQSQILQKYTISFFLENKKSYALYRQICLLIDTIIYNEDHTNHTYLDLVLGSIFSVFTSSFDILYFSLENFSKFGICEEFYQELFKLSREINNILDEKQSLCINLVKHFDTFCKDELGKDVVKDATFIKALTFCFRVMFNITFDFNEPNTWQEIFETNNNPSYLHFISLQTYANCSEFLKKINNNLQR